MRLERYFGALLVASVMCTVFWTMNSSFIQTEFFRNPASVLQRFSRQVEDLWNPDSANVTSLSGFGTGSLNNDYEKEDVDSDDIQDLVEKLMNNITTPKEKVEQKFVSGTKTSDDFESCIPQNNIVFLKTHKTGSSTLTNVFNRYADLRELTVALPIIGYNRFRWPLHFHWTSVDMYRLGQNYANVLTNHARYSRPSMDAIMELDSLYITILRNPVNQFESMFDYMELSKLFRLQNTSDPIRRFLKKPYEYLRNMTIANRGFPESANLIRNGMFFDLGLDPRNYENRTVILKEIQKIDDDFFLVLIMEYFDESLVLMKRELCWDMEDIVYVKQNQRHNNKREKLSPNLKVMIERWNGADALLYRHFNKTFWRKIKEHGEHFYKDLREFQIKNRQVQKDCISTITTKERAFHLTKAVRKLQLNPFVSNFDRYFCGKLLTNEVEYLKYFRLKFNPIFGYQRQLKLERLPKLDQKPGQSLRAVANQQPAVVQFFGVQNPKLNQKGTMKATL